jgi:hypothetical protein
VRGGSDVRAPSAERLDPSGSVRAVAQAAPWKFVEFFAAIGLERCLHCPLERAFGARDA